MRFSLVPASAALAAAALCACSTTPTLELVVTPATIPGDGVTPVSVQVKLTRSGSPAEGTVHVTTNAGHWQNPSGGDPTIMDDTTGTLTAYVIPPRRGRGTIDLVATSSLDGVALRQTFSVKLAPAGGLASTLDFACAKQNIGALVAGLADPIHVLCRAQAFDANHHEIPNASIEAMAEAGHLDWVVDDQGKQNLIYTVAPGDAPPKDVDPLGSDGKPRQTCTCVDPATCDGEPCWTDNGVIHNPRDGVVTLTVAVPGVKAFDDRGEPFVDADDSGAREPGENYIDYNGNGKYDGPSGTNVERMVWRQLRIVWSGSADLSSTAHGATFKATVSNLTAQVKASVTDRNFNTLAADGATGADVVALSAGTCAKGGTLTLTPPQVAMEQVSPGIKLNNDSGESGPGTGIAGGGPGGISGPQFAGTYRVGSDFTFTASIDAKPDQCSVSGEISRTYDPGAPGFSSNGTLSTEAISGNLTF